MSINVQQELAAFQMGQELVAKPHALAGALQQPGHIGQGEHIALAGPVDHAQHGLERGERIVGHLGFGVREPAQQRGFAGVGQAGQTGVGHEPQRQAHPEALCLFAQLSRSAEPGGRSSRTGRCPGRPAPPCRDHKPLARLVTSAISSSVSILGVLDAVDPPQLGAERDLDDDVVAVGAVPARAGALPRRDRPCSGPCR